MKKRMLKKWVVYLLRTIFVLSLLVGASECEDMKLFLISHIVAVATMTLSGYALLKNMER